MEPDHCPACGASFVGDPIPEKYRRHYGSQTHFSRVVGITDLRQDRITTWKCPDCGHEWPRN